MSVVSHNDRTR